jgi:hypothetical protein
MTTLKLQLRESDVQNIEALFTEIIDSNRYVAAIAEDVIQALGFLVANDLKDLQSSFSRALKECNLSDLEGFFIDSKMDCSTVSLPDGTDLNRMRFYEVVDGIAAYLSQMKPQDPLATPIESTELPAPR